MITVTHLTPSERLAWWRLSRTDSIGPITFFKLIERYGTATAALDMLPELSRRGGRKTALSAQPMAVAMDEMAAIEKIGARVVAACEPDYPDLLRRIDDAPPVITMKGQATVWARPCIGIVGARNASLPGRKIAGTLARDLGASQYTVVSGLARGIDTAAHEGSLSTGTVAIVGGGVDVIYLPENEKLYHQICDVGAVISEHPAGTQPKPPFFPRRNRIISGMSAGTCVVEATMGSGSLITARFAGEQGRDVFAVPGSPLDPRAAGPNMLIREGAVLVEKADHIISHLTLFKNGHILSERDGSGYTPGTAAQDPQITANDRNMVLEVLSPTPVMVDEIVRACHLNVGTLQIILLELELAGRVQRLPGNRIVLIEKEDLLDNERIGHR